MNLQGLELEHDLDLVLVLLVLTLPSKCERLGWTKGKVHEHKHPVRCKHPFKPCRYVIASGVWLD